MNEEIWKDITGYTGIYQISNKGRIKSLERYDKNNRFRKSVILKTSFNKDNSEKINLSNNGIKITYSVPRLVYREFSNDKTFDYNNKLMVVAHRDFNTKNNHINNLYLIDRRSFGELINEKQDKKNYLYKKARVRCITTGECFNSINEACRRYKLKTNSGNISRCCTGRSKYSGKDEYGNKLIWEYIK